MNFIPNLSFDEETMANYQRLKLLVENNNIDKAKLCCKLKRVDDTLYITNGNGKTNKYTFADSLGGFEDNIKGIIYILCDEMLETAKLRNEYFQSEKKYFIINKITTGILIALLPFEIYAINHAGINAIYSLIPYCVTVAINVISSVKSISLFQLAEYIKYELFLKELEAQNDEKAHEIHYPSVFRNPEPLSIDNLDNISYLDLKIALINIKNTLQ